VCKFGKNWCLVGSAPGLPDGLFSNQKSQFMYILEGLAMENLGIFHEDLVYFRAIGNFFTAIWYILWSLVYFFPFWYFGPRKIWQP
jgi:hypothetical protein